eukprot:TRINITY_DN1206_c0_g1_i1.p3 TRINITY_DN1206_c0_g1~~TRINITY_DN1206_c0_g1_i1.p3  ORF type:complete len:113 (+),score=4.79 TRINITY_DN1206_c0_g1_i1:192-530(+)
MNRERIEFDFVCSKPIESTNCDIIEPETCEFKENESFKADSKVSDCVYFQPPSPVLKPCKCPKRIPSFLELPPLLEPIGSMSKDIAPFDLGALSEFEQLPSFYLQFEGTNED